MIQRNDRRRRQSFGFTLVELMAVVAIIAVLIAILVPVVSKVRTAARKSTTEAFLQQLSRTIEEYYGDHRAYPGPLSNVEVYNDAPRFPSDPDFGGRFRVENITPANEWETMTPQNMRQRITMSENLVLALLGGLKVDLSGPATVVYDPRLVGGGANSLNTTGPTKRHKIYGDPANLSWRTGPNGKTGHFVDEAGEADDTIIPEFVDTFSDPLPILYLRARIGAQPVPETPSPPTEENNGIVTLDTDADNQRGQYDLHQILAYTGMYTGTWPNLNRAAPNSDGKSIGVGKKKPTYYEDSANPKNPQPKNPYHGLMEVHPDAKPTRGTGYYYPYEAYLYFRNPKLSTPSAPQPHQKDTYILISAGVDRVYGTDDDITNFGGVSVQ
jgi:prepilin-type N-terminal cleavage/methylation domain-containing protein